MKMWYLMAAFLSVLCFATPVSACPFCDTGGSDAAKFIVLIFGLLMLCIAALLMAFRLRGAFQGNLQVANRVLEVEDVLPPETSNECEENNGREKTE